MRKAIINGQVFDGSNFLKQTIITEKSLIQDVVAPDCPSADNLPVLYDAKGAYVSPGFIDSHVHFNDPGREEWEGFPSGSSAAVAGGITTVFDMPLNSSPSANNAFTLKEKKLALHGRSYTNYGLWGGITANVAGNEAELEAMVDTGIVGFKAFLSESGIDDFQRLDDSALKSAMKYCSKADVLLALHAESEDIISQASAGLVNTRRDYQAFLESRPLEAEMKAVEQSLEKAAKFGTKLHIVHVSHPDVATLINTAKKSGVDVSLETCPHYLLFTDEDFRQNGPALKCAPPLRSVESVEGLWEHIANGTIDFISSDHSPCPLSMKLIGEDNIWHAWGGIQGVQFGTTAFISEAVRRGLPLSQIIPLLTSNTADRFPTLQSQGKISAGMKANFTIYDPDIKKIVKKQDILFRHSYSPYVGLEIDGDIKATIVNGEIVYNNKEGIVGNAVGKDVRTL